MSEKSECYCPRCEERGKEKVRGEIVKALKVERARAHKWADNIPGDCTCDGQSEYCRRCVSLTAIETGEEFK